VIKHIKGAENVVADCLSRNPRFEDPSSSNQDVLLKAELFEANALEESGEEEDDSDEGSDESAPEEDELDHDFPVDIGKYLNSEDNSWECNIHSFKTKLLDTKLVSSDHVHPYLIHPH